MKKTLFITSALVAVSVGAIALADDNDCFVPMSKWQTREAVHNMATEMGWSVRRIKIDDGCYEIKGYDAAGHEIEVKIDPATLAVIEMEYEDRKHNEEDEDDDDGKGHTRNLAPAKNRLLAPDSKPEVIRR